MAHLARYQSVQLHGLVAKPELNGRHGLALSFDVKKGRVLVQVSPETKLSLRPDNLLAVSLLGKVVDIFGLENRPEYNGAKGSVVQDYNPVSGRVTVLVGAEEKRVALKPSNIGVATPTGQSAAEAKVAEAKVAEQLEQLRAGVTAQEEGRPPEGWECVVHSRPNGQQYKRYKGPNGLRAQSLKQAWVTHERASDKGLYSVLEGLRKAGPEQTKLGRPGPEQTESTPAEATRSPVTGLPDGWVCSTHTRASGAQYKRYQGPGGERAPSMKQAWALHAASLTSSDPAGPTPVTVAASGHKSAAAKRQRTEVRVAVEEGGGGGGGGGGGAARPFVCNAPGCAKGYTNDKGLYQHQRARHPEQLSALRAELLASRKPAAARRGAAKRPLGCTEEAEEEEEGGSAAARRCEGSSALAGGGGDDDSDDSDAMAACTVCGSTEDAPGSNDILLCDACDAGYHLRCLQPPLEAVPEGDWFCAQCAAARGGSPACAAGVRMPAGWESVPLLWSIAFVWPKGAPFTETLSGQSGGRGALNAP